MRFQILGSNIWLTNEFPVILFLLFLCVERIHKEENEEIDIVTTMSIKILTGRNTCSFSFIFFLMHLSKTLKGKDRRVHQIKYLVKELWIRLSLVFLCLEGYWPDPNKRLLHLLMHFCWIPFIFLFNFWELYHGTHSKLEICYENISVGSKFPEVY
jgi:hypothetical protein